MTIAIVLFAIIALSFAAAVFSLRSMLRGFRDELVDADLRYVSKQLQLDFAFEMEHGFHPDDIKAA